jgi:hypothetical protein
MPRRTRPSRQAVAPSIGLASGLDLAAAAPAAADGAFDPQRLATDPVVDAAALTSDERAGLCAAPGRPVPTGVLQQIADAGLSAFSKAARLSVGTEAAVDDGSACRVTLAATGFVAGSYVEGVTATSTVAAFPQHAELGRTGPAIDRASCLEAMPGSTRPSSLSNSPGVNGRARGGARRRHGRGCRSGLTSPGAPLAIGAEGAPEGRDREDGRR